MDEDQKVEQVALKQLQELGWAYLYGKQLNDSVSDERPNNKEVILEQRLTNALKKINPWLDDENLKKTIRELRSIGTDFPNLIEANQTIWEKFVNYESKKQDTEKGKRSQTIKFIDFDNIENNDFLCVNQLRIEGPNQTIKPDIILFVNGLPLAVIECKSPYITNPIEKGIDHLLRYANRRNPHVNEGAEKLFWYNQIMVTTHRDKARFGTISSKFEHFLDWKDPYPTDINTLEENPDAQTILIAGIFNRYHFLDLIRNFIVFDVKNGKVIKIFARYQQYRSVIKTIERLKSGKDDNKGGVIWHTQGSGKSLTMVFLAKKLRRDSLLRTYKLVFLTDRKQLDKQLTSTFERTQGETVIHVKSVKELKELLKKDSSDLITATIQKFQELEEKTDYPLINDSEKIIVLADEAHRTQYGSLGVALNKGLPNATKIAFTGTPLIKSQKTKNEFGPYIDTYTIEQAVKDRATIQILYEGREVQTKVTGDSLDKLFDEYFKDKTAEEKAEIIKKYGTKELTVLEAPQRIRWICIDILKHYREHIQPNGFKAMIVTPSRRAAVTYKEMLDELEGPPSACIISGKHNDEQFFMRYSNPKKQELLIEKFKKPLDEDPLSFIVVSDMLLTGFDAPVCQVMYLDKKLTEHNLLQAIARVNRTASGKSKGFILDYYGLSDYISEALEMFSSEDVAGVLKSLKDEIPKLKLMHTRVKQYFSEIKSDDIDDFVLVLKDDEIRQKFEIDFKKFAKQMDIILPDKAASPYLKDLFFWGKISQGAKNLYRDEQLDIVGVGEKVRRLINENLQATGVDPKIPPTELFAGSFREKLAEHKSVRAKACEVENAIRQFIRVNVHKDEEYYKQLSQRLQAILDRYKQNWEEQLALLLELREEIKNGHHQEARKYNLSEEQELPFFHIIESEVKQLLGKNELEQKIVDEILQLTKDLAKTLEKETQIVDFFNKQDEIKRTKLVIKRMILETSFDDESLRNRIIDRIIQQARTTFKK